VLAARMSAMSDIPISRNGTTRSSSDSSNSLDSTDVVDCCDTPFDSLLAQRRSSGVHANGRVFGPDEES